MFRRGLYLSELIPLLASVAMLGLAVFGLATSRVPWVARHDFFTFVSHSQDPGLFWMSISLYLLGAVVLGILGVRTLRGY